MSLSPGGTPVAASAPPAAMDPRSSIILRMRRGAGWFLTIAILSGVNSVLQIFDAKIRFIFGLGITQVVDAVAHRMGQNGTLVMICVDGLFIVMLFLCSRWAKVGSQGAFLGGMIAYGLDGVFALVLQQLAGRGGTCLRTVDDLAGLCGGARASSDAAGCAAGSIAAKALLTMATKIRGIEGMKYGELDFEIQRGAKFVLFQYCISIIVVTFRRPSDIYLLRQGENAAVKGLPFTLLSLVAGWWGIPWGPIYTIQSVYNNSRGGKDVTQSVVSSLASSAAAATSSKLLGKISSMAGRTWDSENRKASSTTGSR